MNCLDILGDLLSLFTELTKCFPWMLKIYYENGRRKASCQIIFLIIADIEIDYHCRVFLSI